ncbi:alkaline phosphatase [Pontibacter sp. CAU 1760]
MLTAYLSWFMLLLALVFFGSCSLSGIKSKKGPNTKNVVIVVIDGPRYSEMWGEAPGHIPNMATKLKPKGTLYSYFQNDGYTYTNSGHAAITTGVNQPIDNYGEEFPANPSIFQYWRKATGKPASDTWIIASKDKLHILANTTDSAWHNQFLPSVNCGVNGPGTGYRADSLTLATAKEIMTANHPSLVLINFMEPDGYAHAGNWDYYIRGISRSDQYVKELYDFLRKDKFYRKNTALLITSDHGRHLDGIATGWQDHGDNCDGCRRINLLALGPDFKKNTVMEAGGSLVDIAPTVSKLLGFAMAEQVAIPRLDTVAVVLASDTTGAVLPLDSIQVVKKMTTAARKGRVLNELLTPDALP